MVRRVLLAAVALALLFAPARDGRALTIRDFGAVELIGEAREEALGQFSATLLTEEPTLYMETIGAAVSDGDETAIWVSTERYGSGSAIAVYDSRGIFLYGYQLDTPSNGSKAIFFLDGNWLCVYASLFNRVYALTPTGEIAHVYRVDEDGWSLPIHAKYEARVNYHPESTYRLRSYGGGRLTIAKPDGTEIDIYNYSGLAAHYREKVAHGEQVIVTLISAVCGLALIGIAIDFISMSPRRRRRAE